MATIADVARRAGVSQGTVSNVLNGKGNVTSEKIHAVKKAAQELGYTINEKARVLRKGKQNIIGVVVPTVEFQHYMDLYRSIEFHAEKYGYSVQLFLSSDNPQTELEVIQQAKSSMIKNMAVVSCLKAPDCSTAYEGFERVCYIERRPETEGIYLGFDYRKIGEEIAGRIKQRGFKNIVFVSASQSYWNEARLKEGFFNGLGSFNGNVQAVSADMSKISHRALNIMLSGQTDIIVVSNIGFAKRIRQVKNTFFSASAVEIYTLAPLSPIEEDGFRKYELNYSLIGAEAVREMLEDRQEQARREHIFEPDGERSWNISPDMCHSNCELNMLTLESPEMNIVRGLASAYQAQTGVKVNVVSASYEELFEQLTNAEYSDVFDIFRLDVEWLSWFAEKVLMPLSSTEKGIKRNFREYIPSIINKYCMFGGEVYALPLTPCPQLLFYRKDLFENLENRRLYYEQSGRELRPPESFEEYNEIAAFFSSIEPPDGSKVYGSSLTVGNAALATSEFLSRYFSHTDSIFEENGKLFINNEYGRKALNELVEIQKYAPEEVYSWWTDSVKDFALGRVAMMTVFANYASEILRTDSRIIGSVGCAMVPGGNPLCGGGTVGISKNSHAPKEAEEFIRWLTSPPATALMASLGGVSPCARDYTVGETARRFPWMEMSQQCLARSAAGQSLAKDGLAFNEKRFVNIVGVAVKNVLSGLSTVDKALELAQNILDKEI